MSKIELLPEHIIDQIKAGEVIEKPSTLIKEILENAIDSGAKNISLEISNNGMDLISLIDDGHGISHSDLELAFCRHATSKIKSFEDIYELYTYGFRGEALASIASISKVTCATNEKNSPESKIKIEGAKLISHTKSDQLKEKSGTRLFIKDLFYNTPVRMKFIQSKTSEKNHLRKMINAFLLTQPNINFTIKLNEEDKEFYPSSSMSDRIKSVYSKTRKTTLAFLNNKYDGTHFEIYVGHESTKGAAHKQHYLFVNNRTITDIKIHKIILNNLKALWPEGETGNYYAYLTIAPEKIDINVHPNKTSIKFFEPAKIQALISQTIKTQIIKSPKEQSHTYIQPEIDLSSNSNEYDKKPLNYKGFDFNESNSAQNYFDNLHSVESQSSLLPEESSLTLIYTKKELRLYTFENNLYLFNTKKILLQYIIDLFSSPSENDSTPLLVSKPINCNKAVSKDLIEKLNSKGFEIEPFNQKEFILRAFPTKLNGLPFHEILLSILNSNIKEIESEKLFSLDYQIEFESINIKNILNIYTLSHLLKFQHAKQVSYTSLRNLDEK